MQKPKRQTDEIIARRVKRVSAESLAQESTSWRSVALAGTIAVVVLIAVSVGGLYTWVSVATGGAKGEADAFLGRLIDGEHQQAYASASTGFRASQNEEQFESVVARLELASYKLKPWTDRIANTRIKDRIVLRGSLETEDGRRFPFTVQVVDENGNWKALSFLDEALAHIGAGAWFRQTPEGEELQNITRGTLLAFDAAIKAGDFTEFYNDSDFRQTRLDQIQTAFEYLSDNAVDLSGVESTNAVYDGPAEFEVVRRTKAGKIILGDTLSVSGKYAIDPAPVTFTVKYRYHHPVWMVYRINVVVEGVSRGSG